MRMRKQLFAIVGLAVMTADVHAMVLCTSSRGSGTVRVRPACRGNETQLDPVTLGLQGPSGPAGPTGTTGTSGPGGDRGPALVWKDANGVFVGLAEGGGPTAVRRLPNGDLVRLALDERGFKTQFEQPTFLDFWGSYYFVSADCTGTPLIPATGERITTTYISGATVYYPGAMITRTVNARIDVGLVSPSDCARFGGTSTSTGACCFPDHYTLQSGLGLVIALDLSTLGLVAPFHIEGP